MKVLAEAGRVPFKTNIETQMFKYLHRFPFLNEDTHLYKTFHEEIHLEHINKNGWANYIQKTIESYGLNHLFLNVIKTTTAEIRKTDCKSKHIFFQKRATDIYIQEYFNSYINRKDNKNIFTEVKDQNLKEFENMQVMAKFSSLLINLLFALPSSTILSDETAYKQREH